MGSTAACAAAGAGNIQLQCSAGAETAGQHLETLPFLGKTLAGDGQEINENPALVWAGVSGDGPGFKLFFPLVGGRFQAGENSRQKVMDGKRTV